MVSISQGAGVDVMSRILRLSFSCAAILGVVAGTAVGQEKRAIDANNMSAKEMVRALTLRPGASGSQKPAGELTRSFQSSRSIMPHNPQDIQSETLSLNIQFEVNSAELDASARERLAELASALKDSSFDGQFFGISGHTDASGSDAYNLELSRRRAESVREYLWQSFGVDASKLFTNGFGEAQLRDAANPLSAQNRRVEIFNMGSSQN